MTDKPVRSFTKTISWRLTGTGATFLISYLMLRDVSIAGSIAIIQLVVNTILYYIHERFWLKINWGRK
jgi:bifunctional enzyme CysN/CysC/sulfate adenylyltransferase subunit 1